jgi:hypothetical protein
MSKEGRSNRPFLLCVDFEQKKLESANKRK